MTAPEQREMPKRIQRKRNKANDPRAGTDRLCYRCGKPGAKQGQMGFCSPECRFLNKVDKTDDCWLWAGYRNGKGYGRVDVDRRHYLVHRYAYRLWVGDLVDGMEIDHLCANTSCVNPQHLEQVTPEEHARRTDQGAYQRRKTHCPAGHEYTEANTRRTRNGGRSCRACNSPGWGGKGTRNGNHKLTEATVAEARARRAAGEQVQDLADHYGVAQSVMSRALTGVTWSHVS